MKTEQENPLPAKAGVPGRETSDTELAWREPCAPSIERGALGELDMTCCLGAQPLAAVLHVHSTPPRDSFTLQMAVGRTSLITQLEFWELENLAGALNAFLVRLKKDAKKP